MIMNCCILAGYKYLNNDGSINSERLSRIFERWYNEQISVEIKKEIAFDVVNSFSKNLCECYCHKLKE